MLPKVTREDFLLDVVGINESNFGIGNLNRLSSALSVNKGKRTFSSKSARLATIPLNANFTHTATTQSVSHVPKPHFSSSHTASSTLLRQSRIQQQTSSMRWKTGPNSYNSDASAYSTQRTRTHSHKPSKGGCSAETESIPVKSTPYVVSKRASSSKHNTNSKVHDLTPDRFLDPRVSNDEKSVKVPPSTSTQLQLGGMVMLGTGKTPTANANNNGVSLSGSKVPHAMERFQICRSKEEREKSPDSIRIDKRGIRMFPDIGGGETATLKLLSLQHNFISRLENVPLLPHLVVLDLYDNKVERISGFQGLPSLRVLLLGKNRIKRIEGLDALKRIEILDLHGNQLRYVDNLGSLTALRVLNLAGNLLRNIRNLCPYGLSSLTELNLKRNRIKSLEGLQKASHLKRLLIANNDLQSISCLAPLRKLIYLNELVIEPNPLNSIVGSEYRCQVLTLFPNLITLDRTTVSEETRVAARAWHKLKLAEEEARKVEEERLRQEMVATVGPPGSREQVIYQARRRWESLKNYVKHGTNESPKLKTMKSVVTAFNSAKANNTKPSPFDQLYPPATLDLETFPDGQFEFENMESLLSAGCKSKLCSEVESDECDENKEIVTEDLTGIVTNSIRQDSSHIAPVNVVTGDPNLTNAEVQIENESPTRNTDKDLANNYTKVSGSTIPGNTDQVSNDSDMLSPEKATAVAEDPSNSSLTYATLTSPTDKSAKVAVVRPQIRTTSQQIIKEQPSLETHVLPNSSELSPTATDAAHNVITATQEEVDANRVMDANSTKQRENPDDVKTEEMVKLNDNLRSKLRSEDSLKLDNNCVCQCTSSGEKTMDRDEADGDVREESNPEGDSTSETHQDVDSETPTIASVLFASTHKDQTHQQQIETIKAKSKLLNHLRSMSLDSAFPPTLSSELQKDNTSPFLPSDENDEDDIENEVQNYDFDEVDDADDSYSIATSTTTTTGGTSMSTPRRSSTVMATTNRLLKSGSFRKQTFPRTKSQRLKIRDRAAKLFGSVTELSPRPSTTTYKRATSGTGTRTGDTGTMGNSATRTSANGRVLRRCDSAASLTTSTSSSSTTAAAPTTGTSAIRTNATNGCSSLNEMDNHNHVVPLRKQGVDFLVEIEGKKLNVFGQGGLRHALTAFASNVTCHVNTAKFHYISFDSIIPFFGKLRQVYPSLEHFHFRANNLCTLAQLDALSDLQGLSSLIIAKEGNPIVAHLAWFHYASYRLSHWGLQNINGKEVCSEYRGGVTPAAQAKSFESLGFLALSCLPQTALTPLAKRLHMLHCFCCCSPSTSSEESHRPGRHPATNLHGNHGRAHSPSQHTEHGSGNFCTAWDDDPVLLDVIGKEALVYCPPSLPQEGDNDSTGKAYSVDHNHYLPQNGELKTSSSNMSTAATAQAISLERRRTETLGHLIDSGVEIVEKVDRLEKIWPSLMTEVIQEILMDFRFMDSYMKKELKKTQDINIITHQQQFQNSGKKYRH